MPFGSSFIGKLPVFCKSPLAGKAKTLIALPNMNIKEITKAIVQVALIFFITHHPF
jgi:hypothetical protein